MIKIFLKYLPVVAALCLATSCSKDDDNTVPTSEEGTQDITSNGIPFTLNAVATYSNSLSKIAYSDDIETQTVTMKFTSNDEGKIIMYVSDANGSHTAELLLTKVNDKGNGIFNGYWDENGEPDAGTTLTATVRCNSGSTTVYSKESLTDLMSKCAHNYTGTFSFITETSVSLEDDMAYLEFLLADEQKQVYLNGTWRDINPDTHKYWYAAEGGTKVTTRLKGEKTLEAGNIYTISCTDHVDLGQTINGKKLLWKTSNSFMSANAYSNYNTDVNSNTDRLPTQTEFDKLDELEDEEVWVNELRGIRFYNEHGSMFLPARGYYTKQVGGITRWYRENELGRYWTVPLESGDERYFMEFELASNNSSSLTKKGRMSVFSYTPYSGWQAGGSDTYYTVRLVRTF